MESSSIQLMLNEEVIVNLSSDTPDMQTMIEKIVENKDCIEVENIKVLCSDDITFDKEGFESMIKEVVRKFLKTLKLENINYEKLINK